MTQSWSSALKCEKNGFAAAPPAWFWRIGVSTSAKPFDHRYLRISASNFDRVKHGDSYMYVIGMGQGDVDEQKNVISSVAWYTKELTLDHYTYFNIGPNGEMFTPILYTAYLNPYIFDTDDEMEYIYIAKINRS